MGFYDMMTGWGGGWTSWTMYLGMIAFWIGAVAFLVWGIRALSGGGLSQARHVAGESAVEVPKRRYASDEIDSAELQKKRPELPASEAPANWSPARHALAGRPNVEEAR